MFQKKTLLSLVLALVLTAPLSGLQAAEPPQKDETLPLGSSIPPFNLKDVVYEEAFSVESFSESQAIVVMFICKHCPYVQHVKPALVQLAKEYPGEKVAFVGISSNDPTAYPDDSPESLKQMAMEDSLPFPLLFDGTQEVAKKYTAFATPEFFLFDKERKLVYHGQFDDTRPGGTPATGEDLRASINDLLNGRPITADQKPAVGCSIKWKTGNEPSYAR